MYFLQNKLFNVNNVNIIKGKNMSDSFETIFFRKIKLNLAFKCFLH
ncbi:hypothetical protein appser10_18400 [Actinobacillus pleuropneumoniae serovar 10 str. D13039]|nr:hypothetical protein appser10_18400 [Actinobacillus pleuropneumoniae serovar 10 str. D13039]